MELPHESRYDDAMQWPSFPMRRQFAAFVLTAALAAGLRPGWAEWPPHGQALPESWQGEVASVPTGDSVVLADGRTVALASLRAPRPAEGLRPAEPAFGEAHAALTGLVRGRTVHLYTLPASHDRLGRTVGHLVAAPGTWVQEALVAAGLARVYAAPAERAETLAALLALEAEARGASRGLWREPASAVRDAAAPDGIPDGFQLVEGRVLAIADTPLSLFLNFGADWRQDFTVIVDRGDRNAFAGGVRGLRALQGRHIRVRGWVFRHNGPAIRARNDYAIELLKDER